MLKKAAVAAAITAAGLLAVSPMAFAGAEHGHGNKAVEKSEGIVNVADNNVNTPIQACNNDVPIQGGVLQGQVPVQNITAAATGALALFGAAKADTVQTTDNSRSCGDNSGSAGDSVKQHG